MKNKIKKTFKVEDLRFAVEESGVNEELSLIFNAGGKSYRFGYMGSMMPPGSYLSEMEEIQESKNEQPDEELRLREIISDCKTALNHLKKNDHSLLVNSLRNIHNTAQPLYYKRAGLKENGKYQGD